MPELLCRCAMLPLQRLCTLHVHIWVCTCVPVSAPCLCPGACDGMSAGVAWAHTSGRCRVGISDWDSIPVCATLCVQPGVLPVGVQAHVARGSWPRGDEWCWGVPMHVQCCTSPTTLWRAVRPQPRVPYAPSRASPAAVELVPGTAKVNSAGARQHGVGKL